MKAERERDGQGALIGKLFYQPPPAEPEEDELEAYEPERYPARDVYRPPARRYVPGGQYTYRQPPEDGYNDHWH